ncbi:MULTISPECIES: fructosamine kinase family protein [Prauserella salsuginis group]|uniref:Fructosamine kinase family protein n=1 Tax=Prauserella salsuginis TaxID=387889 RepID=A0ABW6G6F9_9PSEU|nr:MULTISPECIES: fructosamine kinase family protein [Prauserella salsuginis group]MCR3722829.1 Fructosamine-3-kinase [Prauserella flava]MCR3737116.1 Fructosamine-3-kinase [Prauserella salsuginis]
MGTHPTVTAYDAIVRHTDAQPTDIRPLSGGAVVARLDDRTTTVVAKPAAGPNATAAEGAGLRWLAEPGDVPVPHAHGWDDDWLVLDYIEPAGGSPSPAAVESFGRGLAALHLRGAPAFGSPPPDGPVDAWIGLAPMANDTTHDDGTWATFYARDRIEPYVRTAVDQGIFGADEAAVFDAVCTRLPELQPGTEPPARLHGDLWTGNLHWGTDGRGWLIDPAAHGGHRETDLAMLRLFGAPHLDRILGAYAETATDAGNPLATGHEDRVGLHQLFPLLVHTVLFGGGYARQALTAAQQALRTTR